MLYIVYPFLARYHKDISDTDLEALKQEVAKINSEQVIHNLDRFGLSLGTNSLVIVIQVSTAASSCQCFSISRMV